MTSASRFETLNFNFLFFFFDQQLQSRYVGESNFIYFGTDGTVVPPGHGLQLVDVRAGLRV
jgi:hypothetical protein